MHGWLTFPEMQKIFVPVFFGLPIEANHLPPFLKIVGMEFPEGYISLVLFILLSIAVNSLFFGIIGEYILRIYSILKSETECIVQDEFINDNK